MSKIGLFYDTDTGTTRKVAKQIRKLLGEDTVSLCNVVKATPEDFARYDALILGTPTLGDGELPENWEAFLPQLQDMDLSGKTVALFGLGDQVGYGHEFVDALGILWEAVSDCGATVVGEWPTGDYSYSQSRAEVDGVFVGLVLDNDNESDRTPERLAGWLAQVKPALLEAAGAAA